jgi:Fe2+ transport system protein FeoA
MKICDMTIGQRGRVMGFSEGDRAYRQKLIQLGLTKGAEFSLIRKAPLGDPAEINCGGILLTLRKGESDIVEVDPL